MRVFLATFLLGLAAASQLPSATVSLYGSNEFKASQYVSPSPYPWQGWNKYLTTKDLFEKPIFVMTPSSQQPSKLTVHYLYKGLGSVSTDPAFQNLHSYMKKGDLSGIIFFPQGIYNARMFQSLVDDITLPENFKVGEFLRSLAYNEVPVIYFVTKAQFDEFHFGDVNPIVHVGVYDDVVEPIHVEKFVKQPAMTIVH